MSFIESLVAGITIVSRFVTIALNILALFHKFAPVVVEFLVNGVAELMKQIADGDTNPDDARETLVQAALTKFAGSEPISEQQIRMLIECAVAVEKTRQGYDYDAQERLAISEGYIDENELEKAVRAYPQLLPVR